MAGSDRASRAYRFGLFDVDERRGEVRKQGLRIRLRGRPYDILLILLERPGELVSRDELRTRLVPSAVEGRRHTEPGAVTTSIGAAGTSAAGSDATGAVATGAADSAVTATGAMNR